MADKNTPAKGEGDAGPEGGNSPETFTQADIDRIVADRLAREKAKYADYDDLKTKAEAHDQSEREKLSEIERLKLEKADAEKAVQEAQALADQARQEAQAKIAEAEQMAQQQLVFSQTLAQLDAFKIKAGEAELSFRKDATGAVLKLINLSEVKVKNGEVEGIDKALEALAKEFPFLLEKPRSSGMSPANPTRTPQGPSDGELRQRLFGNSGGQSGFFQGSGIMKLKEVE